MTMSLQDEEKKTTEPTDALKENTGSDKKSHSNVIKIACASGGFIAVVALCILSSRFSWFGVQTNDEGISYDNGTASLSSTTVPAKSENIPETTSKPDETSGTTVITTASTTTPVTTTPAVTTAKTTKSATTAATTSKTTKATTPATTAAPKPAWTEKKCSGTMYINISSCSARKDGLQGSEVVSYKYYGDAVKVTALTDTGYYKLDDGTYVHSDYLSKTKPAETTTTTVTSAPAPANTEPSQGANNDITSAITDQPVNCTAEEAEVFRLVNEYRAQYGVAPLKWDQNAYKAAKIRCDEITANFSHKRNGGQRFYTVYSDIIQQRLYNYGENIASGQSSAQEVLNSWMNSELHRKNILDPDFDNLAVAFGVYNDSYKYYWVQEFTTY